MLSVGWLVRTPLAKTQTNKQTPKRLLAFLDRRRDCGFKSPGSPSYIIMSERYVPHNLRPPRLLLPPVLRCCREIRTLSVVKPTIWVQWYEDNRPVQPLQTTVLISWSRSQIIDNLTGAGVKVLKKYDSAGPDHWFVSLNLHVPLAGCCI